MTLRQKVALVAAAAALILSGMALIQEEFHDTAVGVFVSVCALLTNGDVANQVAVEAQERLNIRLSAQRGQTRI